MAVTIDATVGGADANAFITLAEADAYMESRLNASSWEDDATTDEQNRAIVEATRELSATSWLGKRATRTQALAWPRQYVEDVDSPSAIWYAENVIPQRVKDATCELALQFIKSGTDDVASMRADAMNNVKRTRVDVLETEYFDPHTRPTDLRRFPRVWKLIQPLVVASGATVSVERG